MSDERPYQPVPVSEAVSIAVKYGKAMVIILSWDDVHQLTHTTTFGESAFDKENAAAAGEIATKALGGDLGRKIEFEDFHKNNDPALLTEALQLLRLITARQGCASGSMLQKAERILKAAGHSLRQG